MFAIFENIWSQLCYCDAYSMQGLHKSKRIPYWCNGIVFYSLPMTIYNKIEMNFIFFFFIKPTQFVVWLSASHSSHQKKGCKSLQLKNKIHSKLNWTKKRITVDMWQDYLHRVQFTPILNKRQSDLTIYFLISSKY